MENQVYKYARVLVTGEEAIRLVIVEDNGDRVMVRAINCGFENWAVWPVENIGRDEIVEA